MILWILKQIKKWVLMEDEPEFAFDYEKVELNLKEFIEKKRMDVEKYYVRESTRDAPEGASSNDVFILQE